MFPNRFQSDFWWWSQNDVKGARWRLLYVRYVNFIFIHPEEVQKHCPSLYTVKPSVVTFKHVFTGLTRMFFICNTLQVKRTAFPVKYQVVPDKKRLGSLLYYWILSELKQYSGAQEMILLLNVPCIVYDLVAISSNIIFMSSSDYFTDDRWTW